MSEPAASSYSGGFSAEEEDGRINQEVINMKRALMNEKASPELLPFETELVSDLSSKLKSQQEILDSSTFGASDTVYAALYQMEADRVRYILASYFRARLFKIKKHVLYLMTNWKTAKDLLSAEEEAFLEAYVDLKGGHFTDTVLSHLPTQFQEFPEDDMVTPPNIQEWVFCCVLREVGEFAHPDMPTETITMNAGDALIVKYATIRGLLRDKSVYLS